MTIHNGLLKQATYDRRPRTRTARLTRDFGQADWELVWHYEAQGMKYPDAAQKVNHENHVMMRFTAAAEQLESEGEHDEALKLRKMAGEDVTIPCPSGLAEDCHEVDCNCRTAARMRAMETKSAWLWTDEWQAGEKEVDEYIRNGQVEEFETMDEFLETLHDDDGCTCIDGSCPACQERAGEIWGLELL